MSQVCLKSLDFYSSYCPETKIWACLGQITPSKFDEICPLAIPIQISTISKHTWFGENPLTFTCYHPETKIWVCLGQITPSKFDEIGPLAIPNQISTISMHIPNLVKIHRCLLKLSSGNEKTDRWTDGRTDDRRTNRQTYGRPTWNHNTPPLYSG